MTEMTSADVRFIFMVDDYEKMRGSALRTVDQQVDLLTDALHAIRHGRLAVAEEFVDRAVTKLTRVRNELRQPPPVQS
jgi:hypothetical protein